MDVLTLAPPLCYTNIINFHTIKFEWYDELENLALAGLKCAIEISISKEDLNIWEVIYLGHANQYIHENMEGGLEYKFRSRLCHNDQFGPYSSPISIEMPAEPSSGCDLHKAIKYENEEMLLEILKKKEVNVDATNRMDLTPLMVCADKNHKHMLEILLNNGANANFQNKLGKTALMIAANRGFVDLVECLIDNGADVNKEDINGMNAIFFAVDGEFGNVIRILANKGCKVNHKDKDHGWTPLIRLACLANNGNVRVGSALLDVGAEVNIQDTYGQTALLHCAFHRNHTDLARLLLTHGANLNLKNKKNNTALDIAKSLENTNFIHMVEKFKQKKK